MTHYLCKLQRFEFWSCRGCGSANPCCNRGFERRSCLQQFDFIYIIKFSVITSAGPFAADRVPGCGKTLWELLYYSILAAGNDVFLHIAKKYPLILHQPRAPILRITLFREFFTISLFKLRQTFSTKYCSADSWNCRILKWPLQLFEPQISQPASPATSPLWRHGYC